MSIMPVQEPDILGSARLIVKGVDRALREEGHPRLTEMSIDNLFRLLMDYRAGIYDGHLRYRIGDASKLLVALDAAGAERYPGEGRDDWVEKVADLLRDAAAEKKSVAELSLFVAALLPKMSG